jgi:hypothetical protein
VCDTFHLSLKYDYAPGDSSIIYFSDEGNQLLTSQSWIIRSLYDSLTYVNFSTPNPFYHFTDTGHYLVCITAQSASGCSSGYCEVVYGGSKHGKPANSTVTSYPNPAVGEVSLTMPLVTAGKLIINVYNANGLRVYSVQKQGTSGNNQIKIPVHQLPPGQYFIEITAGNERKRSVFQKL